MKGIIVGLMLGMTVTGSSTYPLAGIVTEVDVRNDVVTFTTYSGNEFAFYGTEDWMEGDLVAAIMDDRGTESVYDDEILEVRYAGFTGGWEGWE